MIVLHIQLTDVNVNLFVGNVCDLPEKILKDFTIYGCSGHLGHVTDIILTYFHFLDSKRLQTNMVKVAQWFLGKASFNFDM